MIRIVINNKVDGRSFGADFSTSTELDVWFEKEKLNKSFGKNDRELQAKKDVDGNWYVDNEDVSKAISFRDEEIIISPEIPADPEIPDSVPIPEVKVINRYYSFKADYEVVITDVTAEYDAIEQKKNLIAITTSALKTTKPVMNALELSDAVNKILQVLGIK